MEDRLASPVENYPGLFGNNSFLGGRHGVSWMRKWPDALPNVVSAIFLFTAEMVIFFGLQEVTAPLFLTETGNTNVLSLESLRYKPDLRLRIRKAIYDIPRLEACKHINTQLSNLTTSTTIPTFAPQAPTSILNRVLILPPQSYPIRLNLNSPSD